MTNLNDWQLYLEDQCQGVFLILEEDLEPVFGVELLAGLEPGESRFLSPLHSLLTTLQQSENVLGICKKDKTYDTEQVWSLTQFYSLDFSQSAIFVSVLGALCLARHT